MVLILISPTEKERECNEKVSPPHQQKKKGNAMKKSLLLVAGTFCAALLMTGCAGISTNNGGVAPISAGPNFYTEVSANAILQPVAGNDYTVVKRDVTASAKLMSYFTCVNIGDVSFATLKAEALKQAPGAQDLVDVKMDLRNQRGYGDPDRNGSEIQQITFGQKQVGNC